MSRTSISLPIRNDIPLADQCSHGKTWKEPCIDCEIVSMTEWLRTMEPRIQRDRATLDRLLAERASLNGSGEWQPIETAPRDGTEFQAWVVHMGHGYWDWQCRYNEHGAFESFGRIDYDMDGWEVSPGTPTHWMPNPSAPTKGEKP